MRSCLISDDDNVREIVRSVVQGDLTVVQPGDEVGPADLYIWEFDARSEAVVFSSATAPKNLVLLHRNDLPAFAERCGSHASCVLLKPFTASTFRVFFQAAEADWRRQTHAEEAEALRSDRDILLQYVLRANLRLQEHDQDRTNFLARALHDLRAPLTALHGYCGLLLAEQLGPLNAEQTDLLVRMQYSTRRLSRLATGMFELSVQGQVNRALQPEPGDIGECLSQALHDVQPFIQQKHLNITVNIAAPARPLFFEPDKIQQVVINLLENACKFAPRFGSVDIRGYSVGHDNPDQQSSDSHGLEGYRIDVRDSGPGIHPDHLIDIFEQYTSYTGSEDRTGGGLGLAICKLIVNSHGGEIWAEGLSDGAMFSFILPFVPKATPAKYRPDHVEQVAEHAVC